MTSQSADQLLVRAAQGDEEALENFYNQHHQQVYNWTRLRVRDAHLAEDLAQEVWLKVAQKAQHYQAGTNVTAWLYTVTNNTVIDYLRAQGRRPNEVLHADLLQLDQPRADLTPHECAEREQLAQAVQTQLGKLRANQRDCLRLRFFEGLTPAEIGQIMGKSPGAVRVLTVRSLAKFVAGLPTGDSSAKLIEELLTVVSGRAKVVGVRVTTTGRTTVERDEHATTH
ncbi:RNA polymerase sigma-70 factor (ECF subfamily) [Streptomyces sp. BK022]|uniref:RNA polymerase sigma factor n=1 Tax=Streptomyces sp. BK022 TaxID=2512123 RepID=UPI0010E053F4|nr:RNA polymerase sigma factor [Streptomyces sp. BK022]RZU28198.1 RNA polymerase sigma-70 factor (ECF subfamily) [Streptomyces sp. BK022]